MIKNYILEHFGMLFGSLLLLFIVIKMIMMRRARIKRSYGKLFFQSLQVHNYGSLRNTFDERLKKFYAASNGANKIFYPIFIVVLLIYLFMSMV